MLPLHQTVLLLELDYSPTYLFYFCAHEFHFASFRTNIYRLRTGCVAITLSNNLYSRPDSNRQPLRSRRSIRPTGILLYVAVRTRIGTRGNRSTICDVTITPTNLFSFSKGSIFFAATADMIFNRCRGWQLSPFYLFLFLCLSIFTAINLASNTAIKNFILLTGNKKPGRLQRPGSCTQVFTYVPIISGHLW